MKNTQKDTAVGIHWHDYFELEIIVSGIEEVTYNNEKNLLRHAETQPLCRTAISTL
ncbi:MAG: hypothetical protein L6V93_08655 [Clostridiales bacterium]|nr:MAG: hypothetical protein L6V93_08655 [Clostridiales bacterium]